MKLFCLKYNPGKKSWYTWHFLKISSSLTPPHPPPTPSFPIQCWVSALKVSPLNQHCMGGGGRAKVWERNRFHHRTGGLNENIANFQGVPWTLDQDCRLTNGNFVLPRIDNIISRTYICTCIKQFWSFSFRRDWNWTEWTQKTTTIILSISPPQVTKPTGHPPGTSSANLPRMESSFPTVPSFSAKSSTNATASGETPQSSETPDKSTSSSRGSRGTLTFHATTTTRAHLARGGSSINVSSVKPEGSHGTAPPATTTKATGSSSTEAGTGK